MMFMPMRQTQSHIRMRRIFSLWLLFAIAQCAAVSLESKKFKNSNSAFPPAALAASAAGPSSSRSIVVVGAGFAGLCAALELQQLGYRVLELCLGRVFFTLFRITLPCRRRHNVTIIERQPRVGGRSNHFDAHGFQFDEGSPRASPYAL